MLYILGEGFHPFLWLFFFFLNYILAITIWHCCRWYCRCVGEKTKWVGSKI